MPNEFKSSINISLEFLLYSFVKEIKNYLSLIKLQLSTRKYRFDFNYKGENATRPEHYSMIQLNNSTDYVDAVIAEEAKHLNNDTSKIIVAGYCQGACIAYNTFLKTKHKLK
jgi:dienelactone hydrolase